MTYHKRIEDLPIYSLDRAFTAVVMPTMGVVYDVGLRLDRYLEQTHGRMFIEQRLGWSGSAKIDLINVKSGEVVWSALRARFMQLDFCYGSTDLSSVAARKGELHVLRFWLLDTDGERTPPGYDIRFRHRDDWPEEEDQGRYKRPYPANNDH